MNGMACMAIGAFAAYLGMWSLNDNAHWMPLIFSLGAALAGFGVLLQRGRPMAHPGVLTRGSAWDGRMDRRAAKAPAPSRREAEERDGDAALLGHEMKNYLCTLKGNAHLLRQRIPSNDQVIIDRIDRVVEKLESFTRGLSGAKDAATASGLLWHVRPADSALACVRTHFHKVQERFRFEARADAPTLLCDPDRLEQVFLNLYANSLEAGAGKVETEVHREGGRLLVRIEDDGKGCAEEDLARIFEPFFTTKQGPARRGLGMFIVQAIVENHGGRIRVRTKNGSKDGSTGLIFTLEFPLPAGVAVARPVAAPVTQAPEASEADWLLSRPALV